MELNCVNVWKTNKKAAVWAVLALVLPIFNGAAGIIPLFLPSMVIKLLNLGGTINAKS